MTDEKLRSRQERAVRLREWADGVGGLFEIIDAVRGNYLNSIASSEPDDFEGREAAYHRLRALADLRNALTVVIRDGADARAMIERISKLTDKDGKRSHA